MEVSFPKLDSDSVQVTSEKGNFDSNFLFELGFKFELKVVSKASNSNSIRSQKRSLGDEF